MKKLTVLLTTLITGLFIVSPIAYAQPTYLGNASSDDACQTLKDLNPDNKGCGAGDNGVNDIITLSLNLLTFIAAVIAVIMMFVSGFKYITAQGDSNQISSAKRSLIYALVGLVVVASAQFLVKFVLARSIHA